MPGVGAGSTELPTSGMGMCVSFIVELVTIVSDARWLGGLRTPSALAAVTIGATWSRSQCQLLVGDSPRPR